jgi:hypothetical protein
MSRYQWEPSYGLAGRYRDTRTGRYVSAATVRRELDAYLDASDNAARALAEALRNRQISLVDWELSARRMIKNVQINAVVMERGGYANMRPEDWGRVGAAVRRQYEYLTNFGLQIMDGTQRLDGTFIRRMEMYAQAGRRTFYASKHANLDGKVTHVQSVRHARDSCRSCVELDRKWFRIGDPAYRMPGDRECRVNCRCTEAYAVLDGGELIEMGEA